jgi:hypothetical protein
MTYPNPNPNKCVYKAGGAPFAKSVDLLHFFSQGAIGPVRTLIEGIGREGGVSCSRAKGEGDLCVSARHIGVTHVCEFSTVTSVI